MPVPIDITLDGRHYQGIVTEVLPNPPHPPGPLHQAFSVWTGAEIPSGLRTEVAVADAIKRLVPWPTPQLEWYLKAGEGGSWEAEWDKHPLAIGAAQDLQHRVMVMAHLGIRVVPWVVVRGRPEWAEGEYEMIRACSEIAGSCVLNLEPGRQYWVGPTDPEGVAEWIDRIGVGPESLWLTAIPRHSATAELGGPETMRAWLDRVGGASWECYDATAPDLAPDLALPRVDAWDLSMSPWRRIPVIQRSRLNTWADTEFANLALQCWHLGGD